ncbi:hypothetical protein P7K49_004544 [Saguinus oedipus]|uniref:Uncharacterized protein n=1 Tax=Saguinus oedipus TaxID=9490 RepID=A0ABQ9W7R4_SAGOE|nr:hypothetical protein P7K49_004544 [Saguinus oedipus]
MSLRCRYKVLMRNLALPEDVRGKCTSLLQLYDASNSEWQLGKTKVGCGERAAPIEPPADVRELPRTSFGFHSHSPLNFTDLSHGKGSSVARHRNAGS